MVDSKELRGTLLKRSSVLAAIADRPQTKPDLVDEGGPSRSTIDRAIDSLEDLDCVRRIDGDYHLTLFGRLCLDEYRSFRDNTDVLFEAQPVLNSLPNDVSISRTFLSGASVHIADPKVPQSVLQPSIALLEDSERMVGLAPVVLGIYPQLLDELLDNNDLEVEIVIEDQMVDSLQRMSQNQLEDMITERLIDVYVTEDSLPYALWIMERSDQSVAGITVYENGGIRGVLMNHSDQAVTWARDKYNEYRSNAGGPLEVPP